jgi:menaquinone-dependent protoporphyrinogen oxidase
MDKKTASPAAVVLYKTKYGSTKQYAEWIADGLGADVMPVDEAWPETLARYDRVIIGSCVRMGKIAAAGFLKNHWHVLKNKHVVLFTVSGARPDNPELRTCYEKSLPRMIRDGVAYVPLWGRMKELDWKDRMLMSVPRFMIRRQLRKHPTPELRKRYEEMTKPFDHVEKATVDPIVARCREPLGDPR